MITKTAHYSRAMNAIFPDWEEGGLSPLAALGRMAEDIDSNHQDLLDTTERASKGLADLTRDISSGRWYASNPLSSSCFEDIPMLVSRGVTLRECFWKMFETMRTTAQAKAFREHIQSSYAKEKAK